MVDGNDRYDEVVLTSITNHIKILPIQLIIIYTKYNLYPKRIIYNSIFSLKTSTKTIESD